MWREAAALVVFTTSVGQVGSGQGLRRHPRLTVVEAIQLPLSQRKPKRPIQMQAPARLTLQVD